MIKRHGDLFSTTESTIGHGVNCSGQMEAGIAKSFKKYFPNNYGQYRHMCTCKILTPGMFMIYHETYNNMPKAIVNLATQDSPGPNADYGWLFQSVYRASNKLHDMGYESMALPQIGCGIGGLEWDKVEKCLLLIEEVVPGFEFEVWNL